MIIDFHAHIYPEKIAARASSSISRFYDNAPMAWNGTADELISSGKKNGITNYIVCSAATSVGQVEVINDFIIKECVRHPEFIGFGTMHQDYADFSSELERIKAAGCKGIKLHPDFQKFSVDDDSMDKIYEKIEGLNMAILFHAGDWRYDFSGPKRFLNLIKKHPDLKIVAAHFGGYTEWENSMHYLVGQKIYFDTSSTLWKLPPDKALEMIRKHGSDKFLFGSDFPMWDFAGELERFNALGLTPEEKDAILYKNARRLLDGLN